MADAKAGCHSRVKLDIVQGSPQIVKGDDGKNVEEMPGYAKSTFALVLIAMLIDAVGTFLTGLGLKSEDREKNKKYNLIAIFAFAVACK